MFTTGRLTMNECRWCSHLRQESDLPAPEGRYHWYVCDMNKGYDNLKSFPFDYTKCKYFKKRRVYSKLSFTERYEKMVNYGN